jgi:phage major head subunit gpT-like protein
MSYLSVDISSDRAVAGAVRFALENLQPPPLVAKLAHVNQQSTTMLEKYQFQGLVNPFSKHTGAVKIARPEGHEVIVANEVYEGAIAVTKQDRFVNSPTFVEDRINQLVASAQSHQEQLIIDLIKSGATKTCYTGSYFFDANHTVGKYTWGNSFNVSVANVPTASDNRGTVANPSPVTLGHAIMKSIENMTKFQLDDGSYINRNAKKYLVVVPVSYMAAAAQTQQLNAVLIGQANANESLKSLGVSFEIQVVPELPWTDKLATFRIDGVGGNKPFVLQEALNSMEVKTAPDPADLSTTIHYASVLRGNGYLLPQMANLTTLVV